MKGTNIILYLCKHVDQKENENKYTDKKMCATVVQWMLHWNVKFSNWVLELVYRPNLTVKLLGAFRPKTDSNTPPSDSH